MKEAQLIVGGKTINITISDEELDKLQPLKPKKTGYERANFGSAYFVINDFMNVSNLREDNESYDQSTYDIANYYTDKTVAKNMARAQRLWNRIHRRAVELCDPVLMTEQKFPVVIYFSKDENSISILPSVVYGRFFGTVFFDTKEHCKQVINEFRDELMWYFTEFRDRADI